MSLDAATATTHVDRAWDGHVIDVLHEFIRIPNVSVAYDPEWAAAGHMTKAVELLRLWCEQRVAEGLDGATVEVLELPERSPLLLVDVPATSGVDTAATDANDTVILYGHLDKQPPFEGWRDGLGPWEPVIEGERLYGRGAADDGYAVFAALTAIAANRAAGGEHARCVVLIEASEESGSPDLPAYLQEYGERLGTPSLVVALDSSCADWDHLWVTTSLRGLIDMTLRVDMLTEGIHSGSAGGVVPSTFRVLRSLLDRIEDSATGRLLAPELHVDVPEVRRRQIREMAADVGAVDPAEYPFVDGAGPPPDATDEALIVARTWEPSLEVTGFEGAPPPGSAGNVLRPTSAAKLSVRVPPTADPQIAAAALVQQLTAEPPYGARVTVTPGGAEPGWHAPPEVPWLAAALEAASQATFGTAPRSLGEGGTIPFMGMLGRQFPEAQFMITGVAGPGTNAHGPNEFLHLPTARRVTAAVAHVLDAHAHRPG
ncbi:MAG TPA: M20/M25/M40 family metallo-hydrolase [Acidimicrobiales bacterium]|nr:M20/M25/M40 family metallo-hydrolase [Acidimicrobiales bacterium]